MARWLQVRSPLAAAGTTHGRGVCLPLGQLVQGHLCIVMQEERCSWDRYLGQAMPKLNLGLGLGLQKRRGQEAH